VGGAIGYTVILLCTQTPPPPHTHTTHHQLGLAQNFGALVIIKGVVERCMLRGRQHVGIGLNLPVHEEQMSE
jgi:hypothetical protein